jgi:hypothetical protein
MLHSQHDLARIALYRAEQSAPLLVQNAAPHKRPFIHPIMAPDGAGELTENEPGHHLWQHGLYVGLNDVNGYGFWTEGLSGNAKDGTFHPQPVATPQIENHRAAWQVVTDWQTPDGELLLTETQDWTLQDRTSTLALDVRWTLRAKVALRFGRYAYGGLFLRMPWRRETHGEILTSEGATTVESAEGQRARWVAIAMPIPGRENGPVGFTFFDHPANAEFPNPWRVDNNLGIVPSRCIAGEWQLAAGESLSNRYRLLAFTGSIERDFVEEQWRIFAQQ